MLTVILITAILFAIWQLWLMIAGLIMVANGRKVDVGITTGIISAILFALYFLL